MPTTELIGTAMVDFEEGPKVLRGLIPAGIRAGYPIAILRVQRLMRFGWMHRFHTEKRIFSKGLGKWIVITGPCDEIPLKPHDDIWRRLPQSIQYPPGMAPQVGGTIKWEWRDSPTTFSCGNDSSYYRL